MKNAVLHCVSNSKPERFVHCASNLSREGKANIPFEKRPGLLERTIEQSNGKESNTYGANVIGMQGRVSIAAADCCPFWSALLTAWA